MFKLIIIFNNCVVVDLIVIVLLHDLTFSYVISFGCLLDPLNVILLLRDLFHHEFEVVKGKNLFESAILYLFFFSLLYI